MVEDLLYELIPVLGFAVAASSIFVLIVMRKSQFAFRFTLYFAMTDLLYGIATIYAGFHGVILTIYGNALEQIQPISCLSRVFHLFLWSFTDWLYMSLLVLMCFDRVIQIIFVRTYRDICKIYLNWFVFSSILLISMVSLVPAFAFPVQEKNNFTVRVGSLCRYDEVVGDEYLTIHLLAMQIVPMTGLCVIIVIMFLYIIRQSKAKWAYNWSEEKKYTSQLLGSAFVRCLLSVVCIHMPLILLSSSSRNDDLNMLKYFVVRIVSMCFVSFLQPLWYLLLLPEFNNNISLLFNQYSHNTERKWQSADDPPVEPNADRDQFHEPNPFGSWYSTTGNVAGEAGVPIELRACNERSISFYYANEK